MILWLGENLVPLVLVQSKCTGVVVRGLINEKEAGRVS